MTILALSMIRIAGVKYFLGQDVGLGLGDEETRGGCTLIQSSLGPYDAQGAWFACSRKVS